MLVAQVETVRNQIKTLNKLEETEKNRRDIEDTYDQLKQIATVLRSLTQLYQLIQDRLTPEQASYISGQTRLIKSDLKSSQEAFDKQYRQVKTLQNIEKQANGLKQQLDAAWKNYAEAQINPVTELLSLVRRFPEVKVQLKELDAQKQYLEQFTFRAPTSQQDLQEFDSKFIQLNTQLANLRLDPVIKDFLYRVYEGKATLADLTDGVLDWCRQGNRAKAFKITFR